MEDDGQRLGRGRRESSARGADRRLRPADALRHRALRNQERTRDLCGGQAADGAQRQRDLRGGRQRFVAAHEEELQRVVLVGRLARRRLARQALLAPVPCTLAAQLVDQPPVRGGEEPAARIGRHAVARPLQRRVEERLLHGVLARVEPSVAADERPEDARRQPAQLLLDAHISSPPGVITGRTSIPIQRASGHVAATSSARSSESQSIMQ